MSWYLNNNKGTLRITLTFSGNPGHNWPVASAGVESCLRKQNHVIEKFYAKPKVFGSKFYVGLRVKFIGEIFVKVRQEKMILNAIYVS